jgi:hypothetical protein
VVSAASLAVGLLAPNMIDSIFGEGVLAAGQTASGSQPLPAVFAGVTATVQDSTGASRLAALYFVSPDRIDFVVPETAPGQATVTAGGGALGKPLTAQVQIAAGGYALWRRLGHRRRLRRAGRSCGSIVPDPIDLTPPGRIYPDSVRHWLRPGGRARDCCDRPGGHGSQCIIPDRRHLRESTS